MGISLPKFSIGDLQVDPGLALAPMSGITDSPFRRCLKRRNAGAIGLLVSEFISVEGLTRNNLRSHQMLRYRDDERPISIQIFGGEIDRIVRAAASVQQRGADVLDINAGCPVPKVVRKGGGAELMRRCVHLEQMLKRVVAEVDIPVTLKTRTGWDAGSINAVEVAHLAEDAGVKMLAVHGRTRVAAYSGEADWDVIEAVAEAVDIPVLGSGDIVTPQDAEKRLRSGKVAGLMIGRGAMKNPWIFRQIREHLAGEALHKPTLPEQVDFLRDYALDLWEHLPAKAVPGRVKRIASQFTKGLPGGAVLRNAIYASQTPEEVMDVLASYSPPTRPKDDAVAAA